MAEPIEPTKKTDEADQLAGDANVGIVREFWEFMKNNKMWWMVPIVIVAVALLALVYLGSSSATAPFIYTLF